jgi:hypothetical protein
MQGTTYMDYALASKFPVIEFKRYALIYDKDSDVVVIWDKRNEKRISLIRCLLNHEN